MDSEQYRTPKKLFSRQSAAFKFLGASKNLGTPQTRLKCSETTPVSISKKSKAFNIFPIINTPPSRFPRVINPFEAALTERLHLPLICSPSLFQRPSTPQHSSTQFEWTIDEVSSLGPANVEPHETQFQDTLDPDLEAKAQAAISSYFKEQQIVPSPVDCPLRSQKIMLSESLANTSVVRTSRKIRNGITQTLLTFPPVLPIEIEGLLKQYFTFHDNQQQTPTNDCDITIDYEARDASLRRKLFGTSNNSEGTGEPEIKSFMKYDELSPPPKTPDLETAKLITHNSGSSFNKSSFGSLSPISKLDSPKQLTSKNVNNERKFESCVESSPFSSTNYQIKYEKAMESITIPRAFNSSLHRSTPDELLIKKDSSSPANMSVDVSFSGRVSRIAANCGSIKSTINGVVKSKSFSEADMFNNSYNNFEDDDMQVSQLSVKSTSSSNSSQHPDTPVRKRRSASRKNLSQSFSCHLPDDEDDQENNIEQLIADIRSSQPQIKKSASNGNNVPNKKIETERSVFYRTDSGFNDMTNTQDEMKFRELKTNIAIKENCASVIIPIDNSMDEDVSMICCSTPSRTGRF